MADEIQLIKDKIDLVEFVNEHVPLKRAGRNFRALCPFHTEKTPSFFVSPERQSWHCFGCSRGGDIYEFLMEKEGLTFGEALRILANRAGVKLESKFSPRQQERKERLLAVNHLASEFFHYLLLKHKAGAKARKYLTSRQVNESAISDFKLGYSPNSWETTGKFLLARGFKIDELLETGLIIKKAAGSRQQAAGRNWYDRFRGRLMFPIFDVMGRVVGFSARTLGNDEPKYINSPDSIIFKKGNLLYGLNLAKDEIRQEKYTILVEGNLDVISTHQAGFKNVVAPLGTGVTENHAKLSKRFAQKLTFAFDNDEAGMQATLRGVKIAQMQGLEISIVKIKQAQDADELIRKDPALFKKALSKALPAFDYLLSLGKERFGLDSVSAKKKIGELLLPYIARTPDEISKDALVKRLAEELAVEEKSVWQDLEKVSLSARQPSSLTDGDKTPKKPETPKKPREILLAEHLLSLILASEKTAWLGKEFKQIFVDIESDYFASGVLSDIWQTVKQYFDEHEKIDLGKIGTSLPKSAQKTFDLFVLRPSDKIYNKESVYLSDLTLAAKELKKIYLRKRLQNLSTQIREAEKKERGKEVEKLKKEFKKTLAKMPKL